MSVSPQVADFSGGTAINISGYGFRSCELPASCSCMFGDFQVPATFTSDSHLVCNSPNVKGDFGDKSQIHSSVAVNFGDGFITNAVPFQFVQTSHNQLPTWVWGIVGGGGGLILLGCIIFGLLWKRSRKRGYLSLQ